jgi:hypothetical protein
METIRKLAEVDPRDLPLVERLFGQSLAGTADGELVLRVPDMAGEKRPTIPPNCRLGATSSKE